MITLPAIGGHRGVVADALMVQRTRLIAAAGQLAYSLKLQGERTPRRGRLSMPVEQGLNKAKALLKAAKACLQLAVLVTRSTERIEGRGWAIPTVPGYPGTDLLPQQGTAFLDALGTHHRQYTQKLNRLYGRGIGR